MLRKIFSVFGNKYEKANFQDNLFSKCLKEMQNQFIASYKQNKVFSSTVKIYFKISFVEHLPDQNKLQYELKNGFINLLNNSMPEITKKELKVFVGFRTGLKTDFVIIVEPPDTLVNF